MQAAERKTQVKQICDNNYLFDLIIASHATIL